MGNDVLGVEFLAKLNRVLEHKKAKYQLKSRSKYNENNPSAFLMSAIIILGIRRSYGGQDRCLNGIPIT